jgi:hypothetical protein
MDEIDVAALGLRPALNPLGVPAEADHFGDPQHGVPRWNETAFFEAWSPSTGAGVFVHLGRWPGDLDLWWCQAITYLPDGQLTADLSFGRSSEAGARTGNVAIDVVEPLEHWRVHYDGAGELTDRARMADALTGGGVRVPVVWDLDARAAGPAWNLRPPADGVMPDFAQTSHSQQTFRVTGTITVDGVTHAVDGIGCNDHSRGARDLTHFAGDQWLVGVLPGATFHVINVWKADQAEVLTTGIWFDARGHRPVRARRHAAHLVPGEPAVVELVIEDSGHERRLTVEVLHGCAICVTQGHDNLNGVGWDLPGDTIVLDESPVRITDHQTGSVGYGHLERGVRIDQARR